MKMMMMIMEVLLLYYHSFANSSICVDADLGCYKKHMAVFGKISQFFPLSNSPIVKTLHHVAFIPFSYIMVV
jgi:hypothetical protein